ncbi:MAG: heparan-alpha-glucosaminide N-acetyltransferase domain-containing protein [Chitinophagaceae bacterium]|nr:heparan-alpha-glucosaminide N-acetyltransferase domain-containing protein [Chitinophagaceae bacterium]
MTAITKARIESIDLLKGLVMVIMALDHVRAYFHYSAFLFNPADPTQSTLPIFFTNWITYFCAPAFSFLAGISAFMVGKRKTQYELSGFLLKRGLWLVFIELTIVGFAWHFDFQFRTFGLLVIWSLGISMIVLSALIHLPRTYILIFSLLLICCHNLFDNVHFSGNVLWAIIHEQLIYNLSDNTKLGIGYPIVPWIAVMALGYYFSAFYDKSFDSNKRKKLFNIIGVSAITAFAALRWTNFYGDPKPFKDYPTISQDLISFLNPSKYPPSLLYLLMTLGVAFLFLANTENLKGRIVNFFSTFGRVPFFYYILHLYLIHILAMIFAQASGWGWQKFILSTWVGREPNLKGYGFSLWVVYAVWMGTILLLYPLCKRFDMYKQSHKEKWWLSYL